MNDQAPDLRILQANERTLLAWVRTGLAMMGMGFVLARLAVWFRLEHPEQRVSGDASVWFGIAMVALGTACEVFATVRFIRARRAIVAGRPIVPGSAGPVAIAVTVGVISIGLIAYLLAAARSP